MVWLGWPEEAGMNGNFWMYHDVPKNLVTISPFDGVIHFGFILLDVILSFYLNNYVEWTSYFLTLV